MYGLYTDFPLNEAYAKSTLMVMETLFSLDQNIDGPYIEQNLIFCEIRPKPNTWISQQIQMDLNAFPIESYLQTSLIP